ncbi:RNA polymerase I-specific transcription initiation factor RRN3 [Punctularia strigosozonata HHB-11173 SS5]|uniref:RNA polymerase I-specific transcription initiation factor RRN3 n=1 Tax=Punctularia strigosozonata (strain HHB-11173) TaxID=741275 RepID=UPI0004417DCE|nr:RNA polymerase I-specific transcription initiation factor RRN3 [Punctularia strigosozonata HHB-11173 SS5]EIN10498.1 RNA polymerase I-specific transcription initiation factor RRN3 [Punctularia strigosozonata HHB-11173 SS5]
MSQPDKEKAPTRPAARSRKSSTASLLSAAPRPIATNSRVKHDEQLKKDMYLSFVNNALQQKALGNTEPYDELVEQFAFKHTKGNMPSPTPQLRFWLIALSHAVSRLGRQHFTLVEAIVNMPWSTMESSFVKTYSSFTGVLLSARPEYLSLILGKIARGFTYQSGLQALDAGPAETSSRPLTRRIVYDRLHYLLRHLLDLIPTLSSTLEPLLIQNFPHKRQNVVSQVTYIRNLLRITEYCPELADRILATIVDRSIQIDVEIQVELEELEEVAAQAQEDVFELDPFDTVVGQDGDSESDDDESDDDDNLSDLSSDAGDVDDDEPETAELAMDMSQVQEMVRKLDAILNLIFNHFSHSHVDIVPARNRLSRSPSMSRPDSPVSSIGDVSSTPRPPSPLSIERGKSRRRAQFYNLLSIFDRTIIRTFKSRYTQFLVFWYSSLDPEFSDLFQGMLLSKALLETDQPAVTRAAATSYVASFVSRARFVDQDGTRKVVALLCNFLKSQLDMFEAVEQTGIGLPSGAHQTVFYAVAQAVFLIFCFRWRDLLAITEEDVDETHESAPPMSSSKWMSELDVMQRVVQSSLNPLKVCSSTVVMQFARVAHATNFVYCYSIIEANKRAEYNTNTTAPTSMDGRRLHVHRRHSDVLSDPLTAELNTFFPFDPYNLPKSSRYIQGVYREWDSVAIDDGEEEDDEDEDDDDDEASSDAEEHPPPTSPPISNIPILRNGSAGDDEKLGASFDAMSISI